MSCDVILRREPDADATVRTWADPMHVDFLVLMGYPLVGSVARDEELKRFADTIADSMKTNTRARVAVVVVYTREHIKNALVKYTPVYLLFSLEEGVCIHGGSQGLRFLSNRRGVSAPGAVTVYTCTDMLNDFFGVTSYLKAVTIACPDGCTVAQELVSRGAPVLAMGLCRKPWVYLVQRNDESLPGSDRAVAIMCGCPCDVALETTIAIERFHVQMGAGKSMRDLAPENAVNPTRAWAPCSNRQDHRHVIDHCPFLHVFASEDSLTSEFGHTGVIFPHFLDVKAERARDPTKPWFPGYAHHKNETFEQRAEALGIAFPAAVRGAVDLSAMLELDNIMASMGGIMLSEPPSSADAGAGGGGVGVAWALPSVLPLNNPTEDESMGV
jgi:hypothetical protein